MEVLLFALCFLDAGDFLEVDLLTVAEGFWVTGRWRGSGGGGGWGGAGGGGGGNEGDVWRGTDDTGIDIEGVVDSTSISVGSSSYE